MASAGFEPGTVRFCESINTFKRKIRETQKIWAVRKHGQVQAFAHISITLLDLWKAFHVVGNH
jgi:hypothetical protein